MEIYLLSCPLKIGHDHRGQSCHERTETERWTVAWLEDQLAGQQKKYERHKAYQIELGHE